VRRLREQSGEVELLYRDILVNMTEFFRDAAALDALKLSVFPEILAAKGAHEPLRIWVPGCSKGQEAYSVLMTLVEFLDDKEARPDIQMFASDVNGQDVDFARAGVYPEGIAHEVSPERLARFFVQVPGGYRVDRAIRDMCVFAVHDVTADPPFSRLDLVSFRNVLIYMERPLQKRVLQILHYALAPGGFLLLGSSETTGPESTLFSVVDKKYRIYRRKPGPGKLVAALAPAPRGMGFAKEGAAAERAAAFDALAEADKIVRAGYQPAGILVAADLDVLQFRGQVGPFLDPVEGPPELKLPRLVAPGLSSAAEAAIREAAKTKAAATRRWTSPGGGGAGRGVEVEAVPVTSPGADTYFLVMFTERGEEDGRPDMRGKQREDHRSTDAEDAADGQVRRELDETRQQLEAVVAERETANSELRATSERFQSSNEELRTINEEFQTAQEELQSTN
jgi:two-component system CheB/CheR fusion protein